MPSLIADGPLFFPNVVTNDQFQQEGLLYQAEAGGAWGLHWVVADPRRHVLQVWRKSTADFVTAAQSQGASTVTNGPFFQYTAGSKWRGVVNVGASAVWGIVRYTGAKYTSIFGERIQSMCTSRR